MFLGLIDEDGLVEVKSIYKLNRSGESLSSAVKTDKTSFLQIDVNNDISLKKNHNYYYQVCYVLVFRQHLTNKIHPLILYSV